MKRKTLAIVALAVAAFTSCLKNGGSVSNPRAGVLVDLVSPNATNTTIILNGNTVGSNVSYGSAPNYYSQVTPGSANVTVVDNANNPLLNYNFNTASGQFYSVFLVDSVNHMKPIIVTDSVSYPNSTDSVKVRFYNFCPNPLPLRVGIKDSTIIWPGRSFETQESANGGNTFLLMKAGTYDFQIFTPYNTTTPLKDTSITFDGKHIYTLFIKGFYGDSTSATGIGLGVVKHG